MPDTTKPDQNQPERTQPPPQNGRHTAPDRPQLLFDWQDWLPYLAASDAPEAHKREIIETLWAIILTFVDLGWEVGADLDAAPGAETCGQVLDLTAALRAAVVSSGVQHQEEQEEA